jgi:hypothetical protein
MREETEETVEGNSMKYLCIGGPMDGEITYIEDESFRVPIPSPIPSPIIMEEPAIGVAEEFTDIHYQANYLALGKLRYRVFVALDNDDRNVIQRLIEGYRGKAIETR